MKNTEETIVKVNQLVVHIKYLRTRLWIQVEKQEFESAQQIKLDIDNNQRELIETLICDSKK
jgi:hypothetical protein